MRTLPEGLAASLASGVTTLARCWRITRTDGVVVGLTDHDGDLTVDGTQFLAAGGVAGSEATASLGFAVDGGELTAALTSQVLDEDDLAAGRFDGAGVDLLLADWSAPEDFVRLRRFLIGEVRREGGAFAAELRGPADRMGEVRGRLFTAGCDADLGDARCTVDLDHPALRTSGSVIEAQGQSLLRVEGLGGFEEGWFARGRLVFTSGVLAGFAVEVKDHRLDADGVVLGLWQRAPGPPAPGDGFTVTAGCDKRFPTCRDRFGNAANFRGFPHMPGNDAVLKVAIPGKA